MKKIYSVFLVALLSLLSLSVQAKTLTFSTIDTYSGKIQIADATNGIDLTITSTSQRVESLPSQGAYTMTAADGFNIGRITVIQTNGDVKTIDRTNYGEKSYIGNWAEYTDGATITILLVPAAEAKEVTFTGTPGSYYVRTSDYGEYRPDADGKTQAINYTYLSSVTIYATDGYRIKSVKDQWGGVWGSFPAEYGEIKTKAMVGKLELTVEVEKLADIDTNKFTVLVHDSNHDLYKIALYERKGSQYNQFYIGNVSTEINFNPGAEFVVRNTYGTFYKVTQNDTEIPANENGYYGFSPVNGDIIHIYMAFPAVEIPFKVTFTGSADQSIVTDFSYDNQYTVSLSSLISGEVKPLMGKSIYMAFDTNGFQNVAIKVNGVVQENDTNLNLTLTNEEGYEIEIYGERLEPYHVTIVTRDPQSLLVYKGYYGTATYDLTGQVTEIEVDRGSNVLKFVAADGFKITNIAVFGDENYKYSGNDNSYTVRTDVEIEVETEAVVRDRNLVVYLDPETQWNYTGFYLSNNDYALRKDVKLEPGYNQVEYGTFDMPVNISLFPYGKVYLNGELIEGEYASGGYYNATKEMPDNSVMKIYSEAKDTHNVTYTIADDVNVKVTHDLVTPIDNPANHTVLPGTRIHIATAETSRANASAIVVKANGVAVTADENGVYAIDVKADTDIAVSARESSGIDSITTESATDDAVYNLQGIRVNGNHLPAGVYIKGGKKIYVK